jgi:nitric oxide reductase NorQ protein
MAALPFYAEQGTECALFEHAWRKQLPLLIKGPTGCGKTRFVEHMAARLGRPLITVSCHDDLSAADLVGRFLIGDGSTVWSDGPLARAVRGGAICYLDEIVEARKDTTVVLHPLADDRRILPIERTGEIAGTTRVHAGHLVQPRLPESAQGTQTQHPAAFCIAGDELPDSGDIERAIVQTETGLPAAQAAQLVQLATALAPPDRPRPGRNRQHPAAGVSRAPGGLGFADAHWHARRP